MQEIYIWGEEINNLLALGPYLIYAQEHTIQLICLLSYLSSHGHDTSHYIKDK